MHIYYYLSVNDKLFTEVSSHLLKANNTVDFSGLAFGRKTFLDNGPFLSVSYLSELEYKKQSVDLAYLKSAEKKYGFILADLINMERHFARLGKKDRIQYAQAIIKRIEKDYEISPFSLIFSEGLDDFSSFFLYRFAKSKNIPFYYFVYARLGDKVFVSDKTDTGPVNFESSFYSNLEKYDKEKELFDQTKVFIFNYIKEKRQPYYVADSAMLYRLFSLNDLRRWIISFHNHIQDSGAFHAYKNPLMLPAQRLTKTLRKIRYAKYFKNKFIKINQVKEKKYFIYPLHFHPEAATLIQGRWLNDQRIVIEMISKALPADTLLIVKEHTVSIGRRPLDFYEAINYYHNVHFVSENTAIYPLIENCIGVVTISSSMGIEAVLLNKPVISFGDIHYNLLSDVIKARDISKMPEYVNAALSFKGYSQDEYWAFFKSILENTYSMPGYSPHNFTKQHALTLFEILNTILLSDSLQEK